MVDIVGAFFAAFYLQAADMGYFRQSLDQHVEGKILTGEEAAFATFLPVDAAAGLHAAAAQTAFAPEIARPVAAAGNAPAKSPVNEHFKVHVFGGLLVHQADFVDGKLARQHHALHAELLHGRQVAGMGNIGEGGKMQFSLEPRLTRHLDEPYVLNDETVGLGVALESLDESSGGKNVAPLDEGVEGHIDSAAVLVGQIHHARKFGGAEVFRPRAGGEVLEAEVGGIRAGGHACQKAGHVAGGSQEFRQSALYHAVLC